MPRLTPAEFLAQQKGTTSAATSTPRAGFDAARYQQRKQELTANLGQGQQNIGTGFNPTFESRAGEGLLTSAAKTVGNIPRSAFQLGKDVFSAVTSPIDTAKALTTTLKGAGGKIAETALEETNIGQSILGRISESRQSRGLSPLQTVDGKLQTETTPEIETANAIGNYLGERYGGLENLKTSFVEDPVGVLADISAVTTGAGAALRTSKVPAVAARGERIAELGRGLEPTTAIGGAVRKAGGAVSRSTPVQIAGQAIPSRTALSEGQVAKALDLTPGDLTKISQTTGNSVADFTLKNDLLKKSPEETASALSDFKKQQMTTVRTEVGKVTDVYTPQQVPRVRDSLNVVLEGIGEVPGLEVQSREVANLIKKPSYTLNDVQRAKELVDEFNDVYTKFGDVKQSANAKGLANMRKEMQTFIEDEVSRVSNGQTNIRDLNRDVATSKQLTDQIEARYSRELTRQQLPVFDIIVGLGAYGVTQDIFVSLGVVAAKQVLETPAFRIATAKVLSKTPVEDVTRLGADLKANRFSPESLRILKQIGEETQNNLQFIEAGAGLTAEVEGQQ